MKGGVDMKLLAMRLRDGDHTVFELAVLRSRPAGNALSWPVPLNGWPGWSGDTESDSTPPAPSIGSHIERRFGEQREQPRGGVSTRVHIGANDFGGRR
jgi:hypothetical protein